MHHRLPLAIDSTWLLLLLQSQMWLQLLSMGSVLLHAIEAAEAVDSVTAHELIWQLTSYGNYPGGGNFEQRVKMTR
ncbi:hypothetical protein V8C35DRAFT_298346 [Trichoderma chlorosporum]